MNTIKHTDIKPDQWTQKLPAGIRPYAVLARIDRPIGIWLLLLPGWWAIMLAAGGAWVMNARDWGIFALFGLGAVIMRAAGCIINDLWDRGLDVQVERTRARPLASGEISPQRAFVFLGVLLCGGLLILLQMNFITILLGILSLPLIVLYPLMKRWTWWPQAFLGLTFNFGALMGWSAITGSVGLPALFLYMGGIFWTLGYDTVYAHQDKEDDALAGIKSTALKFGDASKKYVTGFYAASWVFIALSALMAGGILSAVFLLPAGAHLLMQIQKWNVNDPASSLQIFKSNRSFGLLVLAGLALGAF